VDAADYMISICGNEALRELSSPGKSGSFFYLTNDDRYMIKTMKKAEAKVSFLYLVPTSIFLGNQIKPPSNVFGYADAGSFKDATSLLQSFPSI